MRFCLHLAAISSLLLSTNIATAQNDQFAYAITDVSKDGYGWNTLRKLDLQTGKYSDVLLNGTDAKTMVFDAATKKQITQQQLKNKPFESTPFGSGVAAMAYDRRHNRLYFTPMFTDQLRYIDLSTNKLYYITSQPFTNQPKLHNEGKIITRMVMAPDGNGYALSNDGNTFIRFSTNKKTTITQLGALIDDASNNNISVHNRFTGFGGDIVADDEGNLIIITARNLVFKVNVATRIARYLGAIEGLAPGFTVNGAVVDASNNLLVSSALKNNAYYVVDLASLKAKPMQGMTDVYRSSDLANSNYLHTGKTTDIATITPLESRLSNLIRIYPNPVVTNQFTLLFNKVDAGDYTVEMTNLMGQRILQQKVNIAHSIETQTIPVSPAQAKGLYFVKVFNMKNKPVFEQKLVLQ